MKIGICGYGEAGKDTAALYLASITGKKYICGTSVWAAPMVFKEIRRRGYGACYQTAQQAWEDRRNHRQLWYDIITDYNANDPAQLYKDCLAEQDFLTGLRHKHELQACKEAGLCSLWLWISRPGYTEASCSITPEDCDRTIENSGSIEAFKLRLHNFAKEFGLC